MTLSQTHALTVAFADSRGAACNPAAGAASDGTESGL